MLALALLIVIIGLVLYLKQIGSPLVTPQPHIVPTPRAQPTSVQHRPSVKPTGIFASNKTPLAPPPPKYRGRLVITAHGGHDLRNVQAVGKQDPYVTLKLGEIEFSSKVHDDGGKIAIWNESFVFQLDGSGKYDALHLRVIDKNVVSDTSIGRVDIPMSDVIKCYAKTTFPLVNPDNFSENAGFITISAEWSGTTV